ncbi:peptide ABC transporter ATP-binding protein [Streptococcus penaeicida]|uniref:Peptide ABC transporter ATP-binding protein n=1 Tax=Streptococcus penaeicida TaxID=1765960 RepID=A0A2N8LBE8_9STRE|nr:peptide cleavage/export ABC transporter [Streptococcus penaeicida]PND47476.1 peptide ABC transporter ATP-binding protein [Streptococcus penaeicida]
MINKISKKYRQSYTFQIENKDCGVAALSSIIKYYGSFYSLATLRELAQTSKDGTSALGIIKAAEKIGFDTYVIKANQSLFKIKDLETPFIAHVIKDRKQLHYYVVYEIQHNYLVIGDPDPNKKIFKMELTTFLNEWTGVTIFLKPNGKYNVFKERNAGLFSYFPIIIKQKILILKIIFSSLMISFISIIGSFFIQQLIDYYIPNKLLNQLEIITLSLITSYIIQQFFFFFRDYYLAQLNQRLSFDIAFSYLRHILNLPLNFFDTRQTGEITSRFTDGNIIIEALASTILSLFLDISTIFIVGTFLFFQNKQLFAVTLLSMPIYCIIISCFIKTIDKLNKRVFEANASLNSAIIDDINGIETIKSLTAESKCLKQIKTQLQLYLLEILKLNKTSTIQSSLKQTTHLVLNVVILWFGSKLIINDLMSIGLLVAYTSLLVFFTSPLENIINLQSKIQSAKVASCRMKEVFNVKAENNKHDESRHQLGSIQTISCQNLTLNIDNSKAILKDINITITANEKICFVGPSGSGKTSLAKLFVRFYKPTFGTISIDNCPISKINLVKLRQNIHYLPQQVYLFKGTILENLTFGAEQIINFEKIKNICKMICIYDEIQSLPLGFNTEISDFSGLSGGQKQRIALVRALLTESPILILDEATSGLDQLTEKRIIDYLLTLKNRTIIFIAHRISIARKVDRIIVFNQGKVIEEGTHSELWNNEQSSYHKLFHDEL